MAGSGALMVLVLLCVCLVTAFGEIGQLCPAGDLEQKGCFSQEMVMIQRKQALLELSADCAGPWQQCGGKLSSGAPWDGPTCCTTGYSCTKSNTWWSMCTRDQSAPESTPVPAKATTSSTPPPAPPTSSAPAEATASAGAASGGTTSSECAQPWSQCGGRKHGAEWDGPTCCTAGFACQPQDEWWSSCKPSGSERPGTSAATAATTTVAPMHTTSRTPTQPPTSTAAAASSTRGQPTTQVPTESSAPRAPTPETTTSAPTTGPTDVQTSASPALSRDPSSPKIRGTLTMWSTQEALMGSQCEYANAPVNSLTDPVLPSYLRSGFHCAIGDSSPGFGKGEQCGLCYKLTSLNDNGVAGTPGSKGSAVVMVSNGGAGGEAHFDCILESFKEITGAETGIFDVEFEQVRCDDVTGGPVVINWADQNAHYCKMMFENIGSWGQLDAVKACLDSGDCADMQQESGATWTGCPTGTGSSMTFELTQRSPSGETTSITCECSGSWPWPTGQRCECPKNF